MIENLVRIVSETMDKSDGKAFMETLKEGDGTGKAFMETLKEGDGTGKAFMASLSDLGKYSSYNPDKPIGLGTLDTQENMIPNKEAGMKREKDVEDDLKQKYPESEGYKIEKEVYLRDKDGNIVRDPETGEARRVDFVVTKDGKVVESIEVTSKTADKTEQIAKENRIREAGGNFIKDSDGNLIEIPSNVQTRIERRD